TYLHFLVGKDDERAALVRLQRIGWSERPGSGAYPGWRFLFDGGGNTAVLRGSVAFDFVATAGPARSDEPLWDAAERQEAAGTEMLVPSPTDALLAICVSGARHGFVPSTQWIADASMILRGGEIDWERLLDVGLGRGQALRL